MKGDDEEAREWENGSKATIAAQAGSDGGCEHRMDLGCAGG